jgi:hypothetical protein
VGPSAVTVAYAQNCWGIAGLDCYYGAYTGRFSLCSARTGAPFILSRLAAFSSHSSPSTPVLLPTIALASYLARLLRSR